MDLNGPWETIARRTIAQLERAGHGQHRVILDGIARETGYVPSSLRSMVTVLRFLEFLEAHKPDLAERARSLSYIVLAIIERWWKHDAEGAETALMSFLHSPEPVRMLAEREKAARRMTSPTRPSSNGTGLAKPTQEATVFLSRTPTPRVRAAEQVPLLSVLHDHRFVHGAQVSPGGGQSQVRSRGAAHGAWSGQRLEWQGADELWRRRKVGAVGYLGTHPAVAAFEVRPSSSLDLLRDRAPELILRGHGLRSAVDCVLIILPNAKNAEVFERIDLGAPFVNGSRDVWWLYRDPA
ncbi:hypothetical protein ILT44_27370 [Microvirga sp. BT689]|uniref:hypothetical protein n=1 Tax=Microvirga arvi TaxID=2778731 RepID=UPI0019516A26|nr:hypothetical protein [Microvirga arvi]MBM6583927.1 hypothetical protein [Microvirga arvi]